MTLMLSEADYGELCQQSHELGQSNPTFQGNADIYRWLPSSLGKGYTRCCELSPGIWLDVIDKEFTQSWAQLVPGLTPSTGTPSNFGQSLLMPLRRNPAMAGVRVTVLRLRPQKWKLRKRKQKLLIWVGVIVLSPQQKQAKQSRKGLNLARVTVPSVAL